MKQAVADIAADSGVLDVLVVEDEPISRRAMERLLASQGMRVATVESAEQAMRRIDDGGLPRVLILDVDLPGMNGVDLLRCVTRKAQGATQTAPLPIFITVEDSPDLKGLESAPAHYFRKPLDLVRLLRLLHERIDPMHSREPKRRG